MIVRSVGLIVVTMIVRSTFFVKVAMFVRRGVMAVCMRMAMFVSVRMTVRV